MAAFTDPKSFVSGQKLSFILLILSAQSMFRPFCFDNVYILLRGFPGGSDNLPAMQETQVWFLSQEDPLEKGMATHSSIPAWRTPWTEELGELHPMWSQRDNWATNIFIFTYPSNNPVFLMQTFVIYYWVWFFEIHSKRNLVNQVDNEIR